MLKTERSERDKVYDMRYYVYNGDLYDTSELYHHGMLGQKWGVRRFQNKDGSLTPAGKERYGSSSKKADKDSENAPKNKYDHSKSKKALNIAKFATNVAYDVATLNPIGIAFDVKDAVDVSRSIAKEALYKRRASKLDVDKKTGLPLKDKEWSDKQDVKAVNPAFKNFDENTKSNCALCSMTMELRQRGYDVAANKASTGYTNSDFKRWFPNADFKTVSIHKDPTLYDDIADSRASKKQRHELAESLINQISKEPDGSRGIVNVHWARLKGGHSMYYKVDQGKMKIYDGQTGKIYENPHKILDHGYKFYHTRLDNKKFDPKTIKEVTL